MRKIFVLTAMAALGANSSMGQQSTALATKACVLKAAARLPAIPGLAITGSATKGQNVAEVVEKHVFKAVATREIAEFLDQFGGASTARLTLAIVLDAIKTSQIQQAAGHLSDHAANLSSNSMRVEISVNAAGLAAGYAFDCFVLQDGNVGIFPLGLSK